MVNLATRKCTHGRLIVSLQGATLLPQKGPKESPSSTKGSQLSPGRQPGLTDVIIGQPLQETGLVAAGRGLNAGRQCAEVGLADVQQEVSGRAQLHLRAPSAVIWETPPKHSPSHVVTRAPEPSPHMSFTDEQPEAVTHS